MTNKELILVSKGMAVSDGDGVKMTRIIGTPTLEMLDPFLMLDCFESDQPQDYIGGFPTHPHRGFETVTYLLDGKMRHKDNAGNEGVIEPGGVQWMTAGKGILHSEMPEQQNGLLKGFQLWFNLPSSAKMTDPAYQEFPPETMAMEYRDDGIKINVLAGTTSQGTVGRVTNDYTSPIYFDVSLPAGANFSQVIPEGHNVFIYMIDGEISVGDNNKTLAGKQLGIFGEGEKIAVAGEATSSRFLLIAGKRLNEPVARGGPFVMNTRAELNQAFDDFRLGRF